MERVIEITINQKGKTMLYSRNTSNNSSYEVKNLMKKQGHKN